MEMSDLRWILLGVVIVIVAAVYFFSRARKNSQPASLLNAADEVPSFSAQAESVDNEWMDGVGPVRVVSDPTSDSVSIPEVKFIDDVTESTSVEHSVEEVKADNASSHEFVSETSHKVIKEEAHKPEPVVEKKPIEDKQVEDKPVENKKAEQKEPAIDDVISVYVLAKVEEKIKGEKILSASYALHLDYGDMKIFHRHSQTPERKIEFSMANIQQPGWFEIDSMNDMETTGVSFFMQVNLVDNPSAVLDEMLICAHNLSTMLGVMLCNGQRKILDEAGTIELREKVKRLEAIKAQAV